MIVTIARVSDPDRFLEVFETVGAEKRREHGCRGARVYFDPDDAHRVWPVFYWDGRTTTGSSRTLRSRPSHESSGSRCRPSTPSPRPSSTPNQYGERGSAWLRPNAEPPPGTL